MFFKGLEIIELGGKIAVLQGVRIIRSELNSIEHAKIWIETYWVADERGE